MCKVHANINYFLSSNEMKYDIKPNHQLITLLYAIILLELLGVYFQHRGSIVMMWDSLKEGKDEF
jgi:hypothetical protein